MDLSVHCRQMLKERKIPLAWAEVTITLTRRTLGDQPAGARPGYPVAVSLDFCRREANRCCTVDGSQGVLRWDGIANSVSWQPLAGEPQHWSSDDERDAPFRTQLTHFLACIEQGAAPKVTLADGIAALTLVEAAKQSHREDRIINL